MTTFSKLVSEEEIKSRAELLHKKRIEHAKPPVPLKYEEEDVPAKNEFVKVAILSNPADPDSEKNYINFRYFKQGTPEQWLKAQEDLEKIFEGQNVTTPSGKFRLVRGQSLKGDALRMFELKARSIVDADGNVLVTEDAFQASMMAVTEHVFPRNALARQKRWMRRYMKKPISLTVRQYTARVMEIVSKFHRYPGYKPAHEVPEDEVTDMIVSGCPHSWEKAMILQGFDVVSQPIDKLVEFLERLETTEAMYEATHKRGQPKSNRAQKGPANKGGSKQTYSSDRSAPQNKKRNMRFCPLHNTSAHDMSECKVMLEQSEENEGELGQRASSESERRSG